MTNAVWEREETITCERCQDSGVLGYRYSDDKTRKAIEYIPCDCCKPTILQKHGDLSLVAKKTFDTFVSLPQVAPLAQACMDYASDPKGWLLLSGPYGCGKSHLAAAIAHAVVGSGKSAMFFVVPDLFDALRETFDGQQGESFQQRFDRIRNVPLLVLDDAGTEHLTSWAKEKHFQLVNHRYNRELPTVFTTNEDIKRFDGRIASRLADVALVEHLDFTGIVDYRRLNLAKRRGKAA